MDLGVVTVATIVALVYAVGECVKPTGIDNKWIPCICAVSGVALGVASLYLGVPDFPASDPITAAAIGAASGLAATGVNQTIRQIKK